MKLVGIGCIFNGVTPSSYNIKVQNFFEYLTNVSKKKKYLNYGSPQVEQPIETVQYYGLNTFWQKKSNTKNLLCLMGFEICMSWHCVYIPKIGGSCNNCNVLISSKQWEKYMSRSLHGIFQYILSPRYTQTNEWLLEWTR